MILVDRRGCSRAAICPRDEAPATADAGSAWIVASRAKSAPRTTNSLALSPLANAKAKRQASHIIASGASVRKSLDRFSVPLATRMYAAVLILDGARSIVKL